MDFDILDTENPEVFPPKTIWCYWDDSGEFMDCTHDERDAEAWKKYGAQNVFKYTLST